MLVCHHVTWHAQRPSKETAPVSPSFYIIQSAMKGEMNRQFSVWENSIFSATTFVPVLSRVSDLANDGYGGMSIPWRLLIAVLFFSL